MLSYKNAGKIRLDTGQVKCSKPPSYLISYYVTLEKYIQYYLPFCLVFNYDDTVKNKSCFYQTQTPDEIWLPPEMTPELEKLLTAINLFSHINNYNKVHLFI